MDNSFFRISDSFGRILRVSYIPAAACWTINVMCCVGWMMVFVWNIFLLIHSKGRATTYKVPMEKYLEYCRSLRLTLVPQNNSTTNHRTIIFIPLTLNCMMMTIKHFKRVEYTQNIFSFHFLCFCVSSFFVKDTIQPGFASACMQLSLFW